MIKIFYEAGILQQKIGDLLVQKRVKGNNVAWIITNPTENEIIESIDLTDKKTPELLIGEQLSLSDKELKIRLKSLDIAVFIFEKRL
jgi:hypothetical protein